MLLKKTEKAINDFIKAIPEIHKGLKGYRIDENGNVCLCGEYSIITYDNAADDLEQIIAVAGKRASFGKTFNEVASNFLSGDPVYHIEMFLKMSDIREQVKAMRKEYYNMNSDNYRQRAVYFKTIANSKFNLALLELSALCLGGTDVKIHLSENWYDPIVIEGKLGKALLMPIR